MFWKNRNNSLPVSVDCVVDAQRTSTDNPAPCASTRWNCQQRLPSSTFEGDVSSIMEGQPAEVWLKGTYGVEKQEPAAQLVALAAQACIEVNQAAGAARPSNTEPDSVFTDRIKSLQVLVVHAVTCQKSPVLICPNGIDRSLHS